MSLYVLYLQKPRRSIFCVAPTIGKCLVLPILAKTNNHASEVRFLGATDFGSLSLAPLFAMLAEYLGGHGVKSFLHYEWWLRYDAERIHEMNHYNSECGMYTVTHAMCLAFGYGLSNAKLIFPEDYQNRMSSRRKRYVLDLLTNGFQFFNSKPEDPYFQYYPLLDSKPTNRIQGEFFKLPP